MKHFIVIDMQNDFCTGTLANKDAVAIIPNIKKALQKAKAEGMNLIFIPALYRRYRRLGNRS